MNSKVAPLHFNLSGSINKNDTCVRFPKRVFINDEIKKAEKFRNKNTA